MMEDFLEKFHLNLIEIKIHLHYQYLIHFLTEYNKSFFLFSIPSIVASFLALFSFNSDSFDCISLIF